LKGFPSPATACGEAASRGNGAILACISSLLPLRPASANLIAGAAAIAQNRAQTSMLGARKD
jgi:hypothetical protein